MSAAKRVNVVVAPTYVDARRRAFARTGPAQPTATQVNTARCQLLEHAFADGLARVFEVAEKLDRIERFERDFGDRLDRFAVLLERVRKQAGRK